MPFGRRLAELIADWRTTMLVALLAGGCAAPPRQAAAPPPPPEPPPPVKAAEATPQYRAQLHTDLGLGYYERGQMDIALEELNEALKLDPDNVKAHNVVALVYTILGEDAKAEQSFARALSIAPQDSEVRANWGFYLCTHGRAKESIAEFDEAVKNPLYKTPEVALANAASCSASIGEIQRAEAYYRRALALAPNNASAAVGLSRLFYDQRRYPDARERLRSVVSQTTPSPDALYLAMCIERRLSDKASETAYATQLRNRYPNSPEAKALVTAKCE
jgi:type IV pilus assembly protein PilF